jgi:hypothetical protein
MRRARTLNRQAIAAITDEAMQRNKKVGAGLVPARILRSKMIHSPFQNHEDSLNKMAIIACR